MAKMHPERLLSFEEGWEKLSGTLTENWLEAGLKHYTMPIFPYDNAVIVWESWMSTVLGKTLDRFVGDRLTLTVAEMMEHEGVFHGLPSDPFLQSKTKDQYKRNSPNIWRYRVASVVLGQYIAVAMDKVKEELMEEIEKNGIGVLVDFKKAHPEEKITRAFLDNIKLKLPSQ